MRLNNVVNYANYTKFAIMCLVKICVCTNSNWNGELIKKFVIETELGGGCVGGGGGGGGGCV